MRHSDPPPRATRDITGNVNADSRREIIFAHDPNAGPVTAVRNLVIQTSMSQLKQHGLFERYLELLAPDAREQLELQLGPGWIPLELAMAHYEACERLEIGDEQLAQLGGSSGDRLQDTALVTRAKKVRDEQFDLWSAMGQMHRIWPRLYQGGSVQVVKLGPKDSLNEQRGFPMNRFRYFQKAQLAAIGATYAAMGVTLSVLKIERVSASRDEVSYRVAWQ